MRKRGKNEKREKNLFIFLKKREKIHPCQTLVFRGLGALISRRARSGHSALVERTLTTHWPKNEA
jgi:hypothetical protein